MKKRQTVFIPSFIGNMPDESSFFIERDAVRINKTQTQLYVNPYGFALEEPSDFFPIELTKINDGNYSVEQAAIIPAKVAATCPIGWISIPIQSLLIEESPEYAYEAIADDEQPEKVDQKNTATADDKVDFREEWKNYTTKESLEAMLTIMASLRRKKAQSITQVQIILEMKDFIVEQLHAISKYTELESLIWTIDDEILAERCDDETKDFLIPIRTIADEKMLSLFKLHGVETGLKQLSELNVEELKENIERYPREELSLYLSQLTGKDFDTENQDIIPKATLIRDYLKQAIT